MSGNTSRRYPPELRGRAVRMVGEVCGQHESEWAAVAELCATRRRVDHSCRAVAAVR